MRLIIGENAKRQRERIELLLMGDVSRINDIFKFKIPIPSAHSISVFRPFATKKNRPSEILICMLDRSEEQRCKAQLRPREPSRSPSVGYQKNLQ